jgi:hypothetical protein
MRMYPKFPYLIDNEMNNNKNKHLLRSNTKDYGGKLTRLTHKIAIQLRLVTENCTIYNSSSRWPSGNFWIQYLLQRRCNKQVSSR